MSFTPRGHLSHFRQNLRLHEFEFDKKFDCLV